jgi:hypothetical protein
VLKSVADGTGTSNVHDMNSAYLPAAGQGNDLCHRRVNGGSN